MISAQVQATIRANCYGYYLSGEIILPVNMCAHCGESDDPESARCWPKDDDGDRICPACAASRCEVCGAQCLNLKRNRCPACLDFLNELEALAERLTGGGK